MKTLISTMACFITLLLFSCNDDKHISTAPQMVRLARIVVDSVELDNYKAFLKEEIETSLKVEPGVLSLYAVFEKDKPTSLTILEIYADTTAYQSHIKTAHFLKYKNGTQSMVKELQLIAVDPLLPMFHIK
jgi:quinol monooxygenase YgiN